MSKCIHVVYINNYFPELWRLTLPTIERYARRIGSDLNIITKRKYPKWHIYYEKIQVYDDGTNYDFNFLVDADILVHHEFPDFSTIIKPYHAGINDSFDANKLFNIENNIYFERDGRNVGLASNAVITSRHTHDLWTPLDITPEEANAISQPKGSNPDEYCISLNLAKFGLKYNGITWESWQRYFLVHTGTGGNRKDTLDYAQATLKFWASGK